MKKLLSLLLAVLFLLSLGCCGSTLQTVAAAYVGAVRVPTSDHGDRSGHADVSFSEMTDEVPNVSLEIARTKELLFRLERGEIRGERAQQELCAREDTYQSMCTAAAIQYVRYCFDVTDDMRRQAYELLSVQLETLNSLLIDVKLALSADPALSALYDGETVERLKEADALHDPSLAEDLARERELVGRYETIAAEFTIAADGREWTKEQILSDPSLSYDTFMALYDAYQQAYNAAVGTVFLELIEVRNRIARACGYPSYAEYAYACFGRDYTTDDAQALAACIKETIVPLFSSLMIDYYDAMMRLSCGTFYEAETLARVRTAAAAILPELAEPWNYMTAHALCDFGASDTRMQGSFTTWFADYGAPFLFSSWDNSYDMPTTVLHEFGHYASYYFNGSAVSSGSLDLAEVDSQGLELLAFPQYDTLFGALSDAAVTVNLFYALYVLISGSMEDAFQQYAYHTEDVTLELLNQEYGRLCDAYGLGELGLSSFAWTEIPHTFQSPMYYIGYCTAMIAALELFAVSEQNRAKALEAYRSILLREPFAAFCGTLERAGLSDPFDPHTIKTVAKAVLLKHCETVRKSMGEYDDAA